MASFIIDTLGFIDDSVSSYAETVFTGVSGSINGVIIAAGLVGLPLLAFNTIMQFHPIKMSQFVTWGIRYVIILAVATSWAQFQPIYRILTDVPNNYGGALLSAAGFGVPTTGGLNAAMDEMVTSIYAYSDRANEESGILSIGLAGFALWFLGSLMACVAIIVSAIAKIGLAMAVSLAPIAIASMMFRATNQFFESWSRFTLGFALIPLVLAGVMGAVLSVASVLLDSANTASDLSQGAGFIIVVLAAIFMMYQIPTLVSGLAGSIVASANAGFVVASAAAGFKPASYTAEAIGRMRAGRREAQFAKDNNASSMDIIKARIAGMQQSASIRKARAEELRLNNLTANNHRPSTNSKMQQNRLKLISQNPLLKGGSRSQNPSDGKK